MSIEHFKLQDYNYHKAHHAELLHEAESARLVKQSRQNHKRHHGISYHVLGWIGGRLVAWGCQLQERYGNHREVPNFDTSHFSW